MATGLTRLDVLRAAENMMSEMRPDQITRQKLASRLGVGTGTISSIIGSMDSLRDELVGREPNRFRATEYAELRERAAQLGYRLTKIKGRRV